MPGKFFTFGFETELFTINESGELTNEVDRFISLMGGRKRIHSHMREEVFHSMLEMGAYPGRGVRKVWLRYLENLRATIDAGEKNGIKLLPLCTYPGKSRPKMRDNKWYAAQSAFLGRNRFSRAIRICAFHSHYSLPRGVVGKSTRQIRKLRYSRAKDIFLNQYNFLVAADPACITFCQSSPFTEGEHFAKDSRTLLYRDMALEEGGRRIYGLYFEHPVFGGLPDYEYTLADLRHMSAKRKQKFIEMMHSKGLEVPKKLSKAPDLKFMWGAIRVNRVGTIEYRGTDMNHPSYLIASSYLLSLALRLIKREGLQMLPSDIGLREPFKREGDTVYLPPFYFVKRIEKLSTLRGLESRRVQNYCAALLNFVTRNSKKKDLELISPIIRMLGRKKTVSDDVLGFARKKGYRTGGLPAGVAREISLSHSELLSRDVDNTLKLLSS
jgi:hypothetical protein